MSNKESILDKELNKEIEQMTFRGGMKASRISSPESSDESSSGKIPFFHSGEKTSKPSFKRYVLASSDLPSWKDEGLTFPSTKFILSDSAVSQRIVELLSAYIYIPSCSIFHHRVSNGKPTPFMGGRMS